MAAAPRRGVPAMGRASRAVRWRRATWSAACSSSWTSTCEPAPAPSRPTPGRAQRPAPGSRFFCCRAM